MPKHTIYRDTIQEVSGPRNAKTQRARILRLLIDAHGAWISLPEIMACAAQYNARILELRRMGFNIPPPRKKRIDGQLHTWYRLVASPSPHVPKPEPAPEWQDRPRATGLPLFDLAVRE